MSICSILECVSACCCWNEKRSKYCKRLWQVIILVSSTIGSLALSDNLGYDHYTNGVITIITSSCTIMVSLFKCCSATSEMESAYEEHVGNKTDDEEAKYDALGLLSYVFLFSTVCDGLFDLSQGIIAANNLEYDSTGATILVTATWIGVGDELIQSLMDCIDCCLNIMSKMGTTAINTVNLLSYIISMMEPYVLSIYWHNMINLDSIGLMD